MADATTTTRARARTTRHGVMALPELAVASKKTSGKTATKPKVNFNEVMAKASARAFRGGVAGFAAGVIQVGTFMWMRTAMNYQYANGGTMMSSIKALYAEGGIARLYKGMSFAIIQAPMSRFGDTAANTGVLALLDAYYPQMPVGVATGFASAGGGDVENLLDACGYV